MLRHHVFRSLLSDFKRSQIPAALPTTAPCVRERSVPKAVAVRGAW